MRYTHRQLREVFHLSFLAQLLKVCDPALFVLKGGTNLRFFFRSPRYSEDMDIDVLGGSVVTLKKNGYKILESAALRRSLRSFGITDLLVGDSDKAKHTTTTQRFRLQLLTEAKERLPTKIEFSRRNEGKDFVRQNIDDSVVFPYRQISFPCQHYPASIAAEQKLEALANRTAVQARDVFDLYILGLGGHDLSAIGKIDPEIRDLALEQVFLLDFESFSGQVLPFLEQEFLDRFGTPKAWAEIHDFVFGLLEVGS